MGVLDKLVQSGNSTVEVGRIKKFKGRSVYVVTVDGEDRLVYSTLNESESMRAGTRVIINKSDSGRRYIVGKAGVSSQKSIKEIFRNG